MNNNTPNNDSNKSIFVFEYISCGGLRNSNISESLFLEGFAMFKALIKDFFQSGFLINTFIDSRFTQYLLQLKEDLEKDLPKSVYQVESEDKTKGDTEAENIYKKSRFNFDIVKGSKDMQLFFKQNVRNSDYIIIIAPEMDNVLLNLTQEAENVIKRNTRNPTQLLLSPTSQFVKVFGDKAIGAFSLQKEDVAVPISFSISEFLNYYEGLAKDPCSLENSLSEYEYNGEPNRTKKESFILKPTDGVGAELTYRISFNIMNLINSPAEFTSTLSKVIKELTLIENTQQELKDNRRFIIQNEIEGEKLSVSAINRNGDLAFFGVNKQIIEYIPLKKYDSFISVEKIEYKGGVTPYWDISEEAYLKLRSLSGKICMKFSFNGFFGIDVIYNPNKPVFMGRPSDLTFLEINPRVTTPYIAYSRIFNNFADLFFNGSLILMPELYRDKIKPLKYLKKENRMAIEEFN
ncbi:MAG: ATP-grasp domain-containing protein [Promethearchaeota archaeon]